MFHCAASTLDRDGSGTGTSSVWLPALAARAYAVLGDGSAARAAIEGAEAAREGVTPDDLDEMGGVLTFTWPRQLYYAADAMVWLSDQVDRTERDASAALAVYESGAPSDRSFGDDAGARTDLALARVSRGELDGAREAMQPVFDLLPERRINGIVTSALRVHAALRNRDSATSPTVRHIQEEIEAFYTDAERVMRKAGMVQEGRIRDHVHVRGAWQDSITYSILAGE